MIRFPSKKWTFHSTIIEDIELVNKRWHKDPYLAIIMETNSTPDNIYCAMVDTMADSGSWIEIIVKMPFPVNSIWELEGKEKTDFTQIMENALTYLREEYFNKTRPTLILDTEEDD